MAILKDTTPLALRDLIRRSRNGVGKVGHNTEALPFGTGYIVKYHDNTIAEIYDYSVTVTNAGWGTSTTRDRINQILSSNGVQFYTAQRNHHQVLVKRNMEIVGADHNGNPIQERVHRQVTDEFNGATFRMVAGGWDLIETW